MSRRIRILLGIMILAVSIALLVWAYAPTRHTTRVQNITPDDMQLAPSSLQLDGTLLFSASSTQLWPVL